VDPQVECRSDWVYAQRPLAFYWQGQRYVVQVIISEKRAPQGRLFLVRTPENEIFELIYHEHSDQWSIHPQAAKESA